MRHQHVVPIYFIFRGKTLNYANFVYTINIPRTHAPFPTITDITTSSWYVNWQKNLNFFFNGFFSYYFIFNII